MKYALAILLLVATARAAAPADASKSEWTADLLQIHNAKDLKTILTIHDNFLRKYGTRPIGDDVRASRAQYQKLADAGAIKFHGRWIAPNMIEAQQRAWAAAAQPAIAAYQSQQMEDAIATANNALKSDAGNPVAITVIGMAAYHMNNLPLAQQSFTKILADDPLNVQALNNLAVVLSQLKHPDDALRDYAQAIQVAPGNRLLLDNIAQAMDSYPDKSAPIMTRLNSFFQPAEKKLEAELSPQNFFRWGSTWVTKNQFDSLSSAVTTLKSNMAQLEQEYQNHLRSQANLAAQSAREYDAYISSLNSADPNSQNDADYYYQQWQQLEDDLTDINNAIQADKDKAADYTKQLADFHQRQFPGVLHVMEPGEDLNVPPPALSVDQPATATPTPTQLHASPMQLHAIRVR